MKRSFLNILKKPFVTLATSLMTRRLGATRTLSKSKFKKKSRSGPFSGKLHSRTFYHWNQVCIDATSSARLLHPYLASVHFTKYDGTPAAKVVYTKKFFQIQWKNIIADAKRETTPASLVPRLAYTFAFLIATYFGMKDTATSFAFMGAVGFDVSAGTQKSGGASSMTWSHTVTGTDLTMPVGAVHGLGGSDGITSCTYAGAALTQKDKQTNTEAGASSEGTSELWHRAAPATGTNDVTLNMSIADTLIGMSISFTGSDGTLGTSVKATGTDTAPTVTASGAVGDMFVDVLGHENYSVSRTAGTNQTGRESRSVSNQWAGAMSTAPGAATEAMDWTLGSTDQWTIIAVAVKAGSQGVNPNVNDAITVTEFINVALENNVNVNDAITVADVPTLGLENNIQVNDAITVTDVVTITIPDLGNILVFEAITVTDVPTLEMHLGDISVNDAITVSENVAMDLPIDISVSESITVSENLSLLTAELNIVVNDSITVTENFEVIRVGYRLGVVHMRSKQQSYPVGMDKTGHQDMRSTGQKYPLGMDDEEIL